MPIHIRAALLGHTNLQTTAPTAPLARHEHACIRCPMLRVNPAMLPRLDELEADLLARRARAETEGWIGELEGLDVTLTFLHDKREQARRLPLPDSTDLGVPTTAAPQRQSR